MAVYASLKEVLHQTLQRSHSAMDLARIRETSSAAAKDIEEFERFFSDAIGRIKARATDDALTADAQIRQLKQAIEALHARIQIRDIDLQRSEEIQRAKDLAYAELQASFDARTKEFQNELAKLQRILREKDAQIASLKYQLQPVIQPQEMPQPGSAIEDATPEADEPASTADIAESESASH